MKLALIHPSFEGVGGAEVVAVNQARCLCDNGFDVRIVTRSVDSRRWRDQLSGLRVELLGVDNWVDRLCGRDAWVERRAQQLAPLLADVDVALATNYPFSRVVARTETSARKVWYCNEPDRKIHLHAANPSIVARVESGICSKTDAERFFLARSRAQRPFLPGVPSRFVRESRKDIDQMQGFDRICVNSRFCAELATRTYGRRDYRVVYPLMRLPATRVVRSGLDRTCLRVLVHSRLEAVKNVDTVLRGFAGFVADGRHSGQLHVVGEGASANSLKQLARELAITNSVVFHGFLPTERLREVYDACEVFALLPVDEPFGMVFPEAMVQGLIVIGPNHGGPFEILEQGRTGFVCDAFSPDSVTAAFELVAALPDPDADRLRTEARSNCLARFGWDKVAAQVVAAFTGWD